MTTPASTESSPKWLNLTTKLLEVVTLSIIILVVWGLFVASPAVIYALSSAESEQNDESTVNEPGAQECAQQSGYEGTICTEELIQWQECFSGQRDIHIPSNIDQSEAESMASTLLGGLQILSPTPECTAAIKPFMCLYLFGSCDKDGQPRRVSQRDCVRLRDELCPEEWVAALRFFGEGALPDCSQFEDQEMQCLESDVNGTDFTNQSNGASEAIPPHQVGITCAEGFYADNGTSCQHLCSSWVRPSRVVADDIVIITSLVSAVISSTIVIILSLTILRNEMLTFPKYYLIYLCFSTAVIAMTVLIGVADKELLFCGSRNLVENFMRGSPYCNINGIVYHYGVIQIGLWTLFFTLGVCWGIFFPFHYQNWRSAKKFKYIHVLTIILSTVLPLVPVLAQVKDGYHFSASPRRAICIGQSVAGIFYAFLLPFGILSAIITTLLVVIFWKILKELAIKKLSREKRPVEVGKAQAKILSVTCYHVLTSCILLVTFLYSLYARDESTAIIRDYLLCHGTGLQPGKQCGEAPDTQLHMLNSLGTTSVFFQSLVPAVVFMFIAKYRWPWTSTGKGSGSRSRSRNS